MTRTSGLTDENRWFYLREAVTISQLLQLYIFILISVSWALYALQRHAECLKASTGHMFAQAFAYDCGTSSSTYVRQCKGNLKMTRTSGLTDEYRWFYWRETVTIPQLLYRFLLLSVSWALYALKRRAECLKASSGHTFAQAYPYDCGTSSST